MGNPNEMSDSLTLTAQRDDVLQDKKAELIRLRIGLFKQMATVSSGAIVVAAAFIRDLPKGAPVSVLAIGLASFIGTILLSIGASFYTIGYLMTQREFEAGVTDYEEFHLVHQGRWVWMAPGMTFIIGMSSFAWFCFSSLM